MNVTTNLTAKRYLPCLLSVLLLSTTVACSNSEQNNAPTGSSGQTGSPTATKAQPNQASAGTIAAGATLTGDLQEDISTGKNRNQERFTLRVKNDSIGKNAALKDAQIHGHLEDVVKAERGKKASLHLVFDDITLKDGSLLPIDVTLLNTQVETKTKGKFLQNAGLILGGAVAGHFLGNKTKFKHGTLAGGAAAAAFVLSSPGGEVVLKKGTDIQLKLKSPLVL
ncbi:MAG: hypothetical protein B0A82_08220 [Alkalinema sp. CACIAM 70d]|nr:MAG: hypothetical protein B0A82_08220 [Alkalinema sp. CACIAM 70d]